MTDQQPRQGRLIRETSGFFIVRAGEYELLCRARGLFRLKGITPMAGDFVTVQKLSDTTGAILDIAPRKNELIRPPVSNIDMLLLLASEAPPVTDPFVLDKMTVAAEARDIGVLILINKRDRASGEGMRALYHAAGFPVLSISSITGEGLDGVWPFIENRCVALAGNTGVGKTTLLNALDPGKDRPTGEVSKRLGRGRHTTRQVELFELPRGVLAFDTPGFAAFETDVAKERLASCFIDFLPHLGDCRFAGCLHGEGQTGCSVRDAAEKELIQPSRYGSYLRMLKTCKTII